MKKRIISFTLVVLMSITNVIFISAKTDVPQKRVTVIVELVGDPVLQKSEDVNSEESNAKRTVIINNQNILKNEILKNVNNKAEFKYSYKNLINGFSAKVNYDDISIIKKIDGVKNVFISNSYKKAETVDNKNHGEAVVIEQQLDSLKKYKGEGKVIAILDTGFDVEHEYFALSDSSTIALSKRDIEAKFSNLTIAGNIEDKDILKLYNSSKIPYGFDYYERDFDVHSKNNHGTHVAGIAAGNKINTVDKQDGVAPESQILAMKVFHESEDGEDRVNYEDLLAAIEDSITLGADVINLSLGSTSGFSNHNSDNSDVISIVDKATNAGIPVICAGGNENVIGEKSNYDDAYSIKLPTVNNIDYGTVGSPSTFLSSISVASVESDYTRALPFTLNNDEKDTIIYSNSKGESFMDSFTDITDMEYVTVPNLGEEVDYEKIDATGKIALVQRGTTTFNEKIRIAYLNGAIGVIVYNNEKNDEMILMAIDEPEIPAIFVAYSDGIKMIESNNKSITIGKEIIIKNKNAGEISDFSSWGVTPDLKLKPEISALGGKIYSSFSKNEYGEISGTSMSTPQVAGAVLLIKQYLEDSELFVDVPVSEQVSLIKKILMNTAIPVINKATEVEYSPRVQGAGLMNIDSALKTDVLISEKIELGDKLQNSFSFNVTVENMSNADKKFIIDASVMTDAYKSFKKELNGKESNVSEITTDDLPYFVSREPFAFKKATINLGDGNQNINKYSDKYSEKSITLKSKSKSTLTFNVLLDKNDVQKYSKIYENGFFIDGFVTLTSTDSSERLSTPYMGFYGDWGLAPIFDYSVYDDRIGFFNNQLLYSQVTNYYLDDYVTLGANVYDENQKSIEKLIAFSPNYDDNNEYVSFKLNLLRNIVNSSVIIKNSDGKVVDEYSDDFIEIKNIYNPDSGSIEYIDTYIWDGRDRENKDYVYPDGQYFVTISGMIDYNGAKSQEITLPFFIDTEKAELVKTAIVREDDKIYLDITSKDNHYVQAIALHSNNKYGERIFDILNTVSVEKATRKDAGSEYTLRFDITNSDNKILYADIMDYAGNTNTYKIDIAGLYYDIEDDVLVG